MDHENTTSGISAPTPEQLEKLARLISNGEHPIPTNWHPTQLSELLDLVHEYRYCSLVTYLAGVIASDICRSERQEESQGNA